MAEDNNIVTITEQNVKTWSHRVLWILGVSLFISQIFFGINIIKDLFSEYHYLTKQIRKVQSLLQSVEMSTENEVTVLLKKRTVVKNEITILIILAILSVVGVVVYSFTARRFDFRKEKAGLKNEIEKHMKQMAEQYRKEDNRWLINELPKPQDILYPVRIKEESSILVLKWLAGGGVLLGLIGTIYGLIESIKGALEVLNNFLDIASFKEVLEPLKFAFYCSLGGISVSVVQLIFKSLAEDKIDYYFANLEMKMPVMIKEAFDGFEPVENQMLIVAKEMSKVSQGIKEITNRVDKEIKTILEKLQREIVNQFNQNMNNITEKTQGLINNVNTTFKNNLEKYPETFAKKVQESMNSYLTHTLDKIKSVVEGIEKHITSINKELAEKYNGLSGKFDRNYEKICEIENKFTGEIDRWFRQILEKIESEVLRKLRENIEGMITSIQIISSNIKEVTPQLNSTLKNYQEYFSIIKQLVKNMEEGFKYIKDFDVRAQESIRELNTELKTVEKTFNALKETLETIHKILDEEVAAVNSVLQKLSEEKGYN